jgi:hypothetical protein
MSTPREFMERVVAWPGEEPGYVNIHTFRADKKDANGREPMFGRPFRDLDEAMNYAQYCASNPGKHSAVYYCTSTQAAVSTKGKFQSALRNRPNAKWLKAVWLEIDVGKKDGYQTPGEALAAVTAFRQKHNIPAPNAIVHSGGGFHVYWISSKRMTQHEWLGYAEALKDMAKADGVKADLQCTADPARILRVPGTFNLKYGQPRPVKLLHLGPDIDFANMPRKDVTVPVTAGAVEFANTLGWKPNPAFASLADKLSEGIDRFEKLPLDPIPMFKQCQHFRATFKSGGKADPEPLWMLNLLACAFLDKGEQFAHAMSKGYPSYDPGETEKKYTDRVKYKVEKNLGWPSCSNFEGAGANCTGCPLKGTIRSPLNLCIAKPVADPAEQVVEKDPELPEPYVLINGIVHEIVTKELKGGEVLEEKHPLFMSKLRNFRINKNGTEVEFKFDVNLDMGNWEPKTIQEKQLATEQKLMTALREYPGVKPYPRNKGRIEQFMTSFMSKLDNEGIRSNAIPFGWQYDPKGGEVPVGFAYNGVVYCSDGTNAPAGAPDPVMGALYTPKGDAQSTNWWTLMKLITDRKHPALEALVAISFAAPLVAFTGLYNVIVCGYSPAAGAQKTTSLHTGLAVWGEPKRTKEKPNATAKGIMKTASQLKSLPVVLDEISDDKKMAMVRHLVGELTEGAQGSRLRSDRTKFDIDDWQTIVGLCGNQSLVQDILTHVHHTDAQLQRVFEFEVDKRQTDPNAAKGDVVDALRTSLDHNYGYIGVEYAKVLGRDPASVQKFVAAVLGKFRAEVKCPDEARFRAGAAAVLWAGAALANHNLKTTFNLPELWAFLKDEFAKSERVIQASEIVAGQMQNAANVMTQFFKAMTRNTLWVQKMPVAAGRGRPWAITYRAGPTAQHPDPIQVRCSENNGVIEISKQKFYDWCAQEKVPPGSTVAALKAHYGATEKGRVDLSYGAGVMGGRETVISLPVPPRSPFQGILYKHCPPGELPGGVTPDTGEDEAVTGTVTESALIAQAAEVKAASEGTAPSSPPTEPPARTDGSQPE